MLRSTMCRIPPRVLADAIRSVDAMDLREKESLCDELFAAQPNMLASVIVHSRLGSPMERIDCLLHILLVAYQATKLASLPLRLITEEDQDRGLRRIVGHTEFLHGLDATSEDTAISQFIEEHSEKYLLAYAIEQLRIAGIARLEHDSDKNLVLAALNIPTCFSLALSGAD